MIYIDDRKGVYKTEDYTAGWTMDIALAVISIAIDYAEKKRNNA